MSVSFPVGNTREEDPILPPSLVITAVFVLGLWRDRTLYGRSLQQRTAYFPADRKQRARKESWGVGNTTLKEWNNRPVQMWTTVYSPLGNWRQTKVRVPPTSNSVNHGLYWSCWQEQSTHHQRPSQQEYNSGDGKAGNWELTYKLRAAQGAHEQVFLRSLAGRSLFQVS